MEAFQGLRESAFSPTTLWVVWGIIAVFWVIMSAILVYHWRSYNKADKNVHRMTWIYFIGSLILLGSSMTFIFSL